MNRITHALPIQRANIATAKPVALIQQPHLTQRADTVQFGHHAENTHAHGPNCNHDHEHPATESTTHAHPANPSTEAAPTNPTQEASKTNKTGKEADAPPHVHDANCHHNEPNWFSRLCTGFVDDIKAFYNWLKKLFSGNAKAEK